MIKAPSNKIFAGILSIECGLMVFAVQDGMMKSLLGEFSVWQLIAARGVVAIMILVPLILFLGPPHRLITPLWPHHFFRGCLFAAGVSAFYAAFPLMPLAKVTTIFFTAPLLITVFAVIFLGEKIGIRRIAALLVGFTGIVIGIDPTLEEFDWVVLLPLFTAVTYAFQQTLSRWLGERETSITLSLYSLTAAALAIIPLGYAVNIWFDVGSEFHHLRWDWWVPSLKEVGLLGFMGAIGMTAMLLVWQAYRIAPAGVIASFDYSYLIWAVLVGYFFFDEVPTANTIVGMVLIASSGLYIGFREMRQLKLDKSSSPTAEVVFVPGNPTTDPSVLVDTKDRYD